MRAIAVSLAIALLISVTHATTMSEKDVTCPVCEEEDKYTRRSAIDALGFIGGTGTLDVILRHYYTNCDKSVPEAEFVSPLDSHLPSPLDLALVGRGTERRVCVCHALADVLSVGSFEIWSHHAQTRHTRGGLGVRD